MPNQIVQQGQVNLTSQIVPGLTVNIVPPSWTILNGIPTNIVGCVGTASWGATNSPTVASGVADATYQFGSMQPRKYDLVTAVAVMAAQGGAAALMLVRVTDGTDTAASTILKQGAIASATPANGGTNFAVGDTITLPGGGILRVATVAGGVIQTVTVQTPGAYTNATIPTNPVAQSSTSGAGINATFNLTFPTVATLTAYYTGSTGNTLQASLSQGSSSTSAVPTFKFVVGLPGLVPEVYDNIGGTGATFIANFVSAINNGQGPLRGPSQLLIASAGTATANPVAQALSFAGGTDGGTPTAQGGAVTTATLIGVDTIPRKGMYALRNTKSSVVMLADGDDVTQWTTQVVYGLSEGSYMISTSPAGDTIANFASEIQTQGIDSYAIKILLGDWCYINDNVNNQVRLVSPQGFIAGLLGNLSPNLSTLNKQIQGLIGTQKSYLKQQYSNAELQQLGLARGDVIANPSDGGAYFGAQFGHNTSSNAVIHGDNYTRMTNYIAATLSAGMGIYIGQTITPTVVRNANDTLDSFFANMATPSLDMPDGMIDDWQVSIPLGAGTINPLSRTALGYLQANAQCEYQSILEFFIINLQGGQSVQIIRTGVQSTQPTTA